jgi:chitodextrinase
MKKILSILAVIAIFITTFSLARTAEATSYTLAQVQTHNTSTNCWTIVNNKVYNLTSYIALHPGGSSALISICGNNGTTAFSNQHSGSTNANNTIASYYIGDLTVLDSSAPTIPASLTATPISPTQINLVWSASTDNIGVTGYAIFRDGNELATTSNTTFNNTGLTASTTYSYLVKAYDAVGNRSASSTAISATTLATSTDSTMPSAPTNLIANVVSATQINLNWATSTDNIAVTGYAIFRNGTEIATVSNSNFNNVGLTASTTYSYFVRAYDAAGNRSANSNTISATTLATSTDTQAPTAPKKLKAHNVSYKHVNLEWKKSKDNKKVAGYKIYRDGVEIATVKKDHYNDNGLTASTTYAYTVKAFDKAGNLSTASNTLTITTRAKKIKEMKPKYEDDDKNEKYNEHKKSDREDKKESKSKGKKD